MSSQKENISSSVATVCRTVHNRENPYVQLNKETLKDPSLSLKAKGLWALCLSFPDNWNFNVPYLQKLCKEGRDALYNTINELIDARYAVRLQTTNKSASGKMQYGNSLLIFFERPATQEEISFHSEELKKSFPHTGFQYTEKTDPKKTDLLKNKTTHKDEKEKKEKKEKERSPAIKAEPPPRKKIKEEKKEVSKRIFLTPTQEESVLEQCDGNIKLRDAVYRKLSNWKIGKQITGGKNDFKSLTDWVIDAVKENSSSWNQSPEENGESSEIEENKRWALPLKKVSFDGMRYMKVTANCIRIHNGKEIYHVGYAEPSFKNIISNKLKTWGLLSV